jgi:hypothetical protein
MRRARSNETQLSNAIISHADERFSYQLRKIAEELVTDEMNAELCAERYTADLEEHGGETRGYTSAINRFLKPNGQTRDTFIRLILNCVAAGETPPRYPLIGELVEEFHSRAGKIETRFRDYEDAMIHRATGSFEGGKRR